MINKQYYQELKELKRKYGILQSPPKSPIKNKQIENINFNDGYINKDDEYYNKYLNKTLYEVINEIYEQKEIKLNDYYEIMNNEEYKFIVHSLIADDFNKFDSNFNIRMKLYNHLKKNLYNINDLGWLFNVLKTVFSENKKLGVCYNILITKNNIKHFENIEYIEKWQIKYLIYFFKIIALFDVPFLNSHCIVKHRENKYNFMQHEINVNGDLGVFGTFEKWEEGAIYYFNNLYKEEEKELNINCAEIVNKFNMIFMKSKNIKSKKYKNNECQNICH